MSLPALAIYSLVCQLFLLRAMPHIIVIAPIFTLVIASKQKTLNSCLAASLFLGLFLDSFSSHLLIGSYPLIFMISTLIIKRFHSLFFDEKLITFSLLSLLFSLFVNTFLPIVLAINGQSIQWGFLFVISNVIIPTLIDTLFCTLSMLLFMSGKPVQKWLKSKPYQKWKKAKKWA